MIENSIPVPASVRRLVILHSQIVAEFDYAKGQTPNITNSSIKKGESFTPIINDICEHLKIYGETEASYLSLKVNPPFHAQFVEAGFVQEDCGRFWLFRKSL